MLMLGWNFCGWGREGEGWGVFDGDEMISGDESDGKWVYKGIGFLGVMSWNDGVWRVWKGGGLAGEESEVLLYEFMEVSGRSGG